ncbi:hypothetical protein Q31b_52370 [Novipirellula aureliae]|uniref:HD/PDEase domain-containing protein n=1 Tax=Novipirellula aureliae TaxID=2527966 RepID=A0A5C6DGL4_9BACT|nr:HD domain-containing protein [Novipirellula aureliae]TWU35802.1 hypothetical protein Q31b_52370 [Novipirellula aureliae]
MIPELKQLHQASSLIRIPPADGVPLSNRVRRIIDSAPMRRLASISQLGMVSLVYPGATHSRFEHSLGVYLNALRVLARFADDAVARPMITPAMADAFVLAALLHDVGHWPFCHPIEDMQLRGLDKHESRVIEWIKNSELIDCIDQDWDCDVALIDELLGSARGDRETPTDQLPMAESSRAVRFLRSCLSGPVDIDKIDYLQRDSLHAGVPYGRNFDVGRLVHSMTIHPDRQTLSIGEKGRTAAEMMVFARYVMFSEVYWHPTVRSATAMLQRAVFSLWTRSSSDRPNLQDSFKLTDSQWTEWLSREYSKAFPTSALVDGIFGPVRKLYKRVAEFDAMTDSSLPNNIGDNETTASSDRGRIHRKIARKPYWWLVRCGEILADQLSERCGQSIAPTDILIDAPPVKLEVDINVDVIRRKGTAMQLADVSPVARALAQQQFDNQVKRVRLFVHPALRDMLHKTMPERSDWSDQLLQAVAATDKEIV